MPLQLSKLQQVFQNLTDLKLLNCVEVTFETGHTHHPVDQLYRFVSDNRSIIEQVTQFTALSESYLVNGEDSITFESHLNMIFLFFCSLRHPQNLMCKRGEVRKYKHFLVCRLNSFFA